MSDYNTYEFQNDNDGLTTLDSLINGNDGLTNLDSLINGNDGLTNLDSLINGFNLSNRFTDLEGIEGIKNLHIINNFNEDIKYKINSPIDDYFESLENGRSISFENPHIEDLKETEK
jgi:hypothetical protein